MDLPDVGRQRGLVVLQLLQDGAALQRSKFLVIAQYPRVDPQTDGDRANLHHQTIEKLVPQFLFEGAVLGYEDGMTAEALNLGNDVRVTSRLVGIIKTWWKAERESVFTEIEQWSHVVAADLKNTRPLIEAHLKTTA